MSVFPSSQATIDLQVLPTFPANVVATGAVDISKSGLSYTFGLNFQNVIEETNVSDMSKREVLVQDTDTGAFWRVKLSNLRTGGIAGNLTVGGEFTYGKAKRISDTNLNDLTVPGFYDGNNLTNAPNGNSNWFYIEVQRHSLNNDYVYQRATALNHSNYATWVRNSHAGVWHPWRQVWDDGNLDPWAVQPIGVPIPVFGHISGVSAPPRNKSYRYVNLTAGQTGSGQYNEGILTNETVSGSAPLVNATAVINLPASPMHGQTIRLIGTERRFIRAGSSGELQDDAMQSHSHTYFSPQQTGGGATGSTNFYWFAATVNTGNHSGRSADETRPRNIGATYYMRIL